MKKKIIIIFLIIIAILITDNFIFFNKKENVEYITAKAEITDLVQTVSEVGTVKAVQEVELNFLQKV